VNSISASRFKERCLFLLGRLDDQGIVITKHGKPVAKVVRIESSADNLIGALKGKLKIKGDIFSTSERWNALSKRPRR
jgi:antitoxin (DNA-binding transcriptional repressor) of toxin-antitoxin stability system